MDRRFERRMVPRLQSGQCRGGRAEGGNGERAEYEDHRQADQHGATQVVEHGIQRQGLDNGKLGLGERQLPVGNF